MAKLNFYNSLDEKKKFFNEADLTYYKIDTSSQFDEWYSCVKKMNTEENLYENFFRGMNEAKYNLYNSAQRYWIQNNLCDSDDSVSYIKNIQKMLEEVKKITLFRQVFEYYDILDNEMDFPLLSILQHYGAATPLMDWTYNIDIALFFAIQNEKKTETKNNIENYVSIYCIHKETHQSFIMNNLNSMSANIFPSVEFLADYLKSNKKVVYISDFEISKFENLNLNEALKQEVQKYSAEISKETRVKRIRSIKPLTTYYNLNILAQKGIFIFNPHASKPLEKFAYISETKNDERIFCYNINKSLADLIKLKIKENNIDDLFIYPDLKKFANSILDDYIQSIVDS